MSNKRPTDDLAALRDEVVRAYTRFIEMVDGFDPVVLETEPAVGSWSVRDVAGHLADWQNEMLDAAEHILGGPKPKHHPIKHGQSYNMIQAAVRGTDSWETAAADLHASYERALAFLDRLSPEQLRAIGPYPWGEVGSLGKLIEELVLHLDEHGEQIVEWRLRRG